MSMQAQALTAEVESPEEIAMHTVNAVIEVTANSQDDLAFSTSSLDISIDGKDITLQPASVKEQPVLYNLTFQAGAGIELFLTPAVTFGQEEKKGTLVVNPTAFGKAFTLSFVNDLAPLARTISYDFNILWAPSGLEALVRRVTTDPTILLDPPNS